MVPFVLGQGDFFVVVVVKISNLALSIEPDFWKTRSQDICALEARLYRGDLVLFHLVSILPFSDILKNEL